MGIFRFQADFLGDKDVRVKINGVFSSLQLDLNPSIHRVNGKHQGYALEGQEREKAEKEALADPKGTELKVFTRFGRIILKLFMISSNRQNISR